MNETLLKIDGLKTYFDTEDGLVKAIDDVSYEINKGETFGVVGESGSGKSMTALSIMRLIPDPGRIAGGNIYFNNEDLLTKTKKEMQKIRGNKISMIFQDPMTSLNPVYTVGDQIIEVLRLHRNKKGQEAKDIAVEMLKKVNVSNPEQRVDEYPHQLSGGMRQRVMIAMALSCEPQLLIADEPTTALDVTIQAQILKVMEKAISETNTAIMFITHDLSVISNICDRVVVMYAGKAVEMADVRTIFKKPKHPYTYGLINSVPRISDVGRRLLEIGGDVADSKNLPSGCSFHPRCDHADEKCRAQMPDLNADADGNKFRCWHPLNI